MLECGATLDEIRDSANRSLVSAHRNHWDEVPSGALTASRQNFGEVREYPSV
jgi:hypothetical protein